MIIVKGVVILHLKLTHTNRLASHHRGKAKLENLPIIPFPFLPR